ncbi:hypothetical protein pipiens_018689 [Culex pipiens pipiens]|uniref:Uncharacterized protein n=1 Tax=Culex pipiens pipiens TaxID=38569 RepID=A0ABD1CAL2_CULPP
MALCFELLRNSKLPGQNGVAMQCEATGQISTSGCIEKDDLINPRINLVNRWREEHGAFYFFTASDPKTQQHHNSDCPRFFISFTEENLRPHVNNGKQPNAPLRQQRRAPSEPNSANDYATNKPNRRRPEQPEWCQALRTITVVAT